MTDAASDTTRGARRLTAPGNGGVAAIAIETPLAEERLAALFSAPLPRRGEISFGVLRDPATGDVLDEVLVVRADRLELHVHGAPMLVGDVLDRLGASDDRSPRSLEERARRLAPHVPTLLGARILVDQSRGVLRRALEEARSLAASGDRSAAEGTLFALVRRGRRAERLWTRTVVAITGPVNAGKSTLFNVLVGDEEALVSEIAGTTRDVLASYAKFGIWPAIVLDTAGERDLGLARSIAVHAADRDHLALEGEGIERGATAAGRAEVVFRLSTGEAGASGGSGVPLRTRCVETFGEDATRWPANGISAFEMPAHARSRCAEGFAAELDLPLRAADVWTPGTAVPFERSMIDRLEAILRGGGDALGALDALLRDG